jgi:Cd2+/Zn2+-exporting ATPase
MEDLGVCTAALETALGELEGRGQTPVVLSDGSRALGLIGVADQLRVGASESLAALRGLGIRPLMVLTGDTARTAAAIGQQAGADEVRAQLLPEEKVRVIQDLARRHGSVGMVGDGINDAPALAAATVGIAMGAAGTDVALETADVALMADDLAKLAYAMRLARRNQSVVNQNLALSAVVIGALVLGAVGGFFTLPIAVLGHEISEFVVIGSGLRMLRS